MNVVRHELCLRASISVVSCINKCCESCIHKCCEASVMCVFMHKCCQFRVMSYVRVHAYVWESCRPCVTWLMPRIKGHIHANREYVTFTCDMTHVTYSWCMSKCMWYHAFIRDMHMWHDAFICGIRMWHDAFICDIHMWHDAFMWRSCQHDSRHVWFAWIRLTYE